MKNASTLIQIVLAVAILVLYILFFTQQRTSQTVVADTETNAESAEIFTDTIPVNLPEFSIVYINSDTLMANYQLVKDMKKQLEKRMSDYEKSFETKLKKFETEVKNFQESARYYTQEEGQKKQMELMQKEQELTELKEDLSTKLLEEEQKMNVELKKRISDFLKKHNAGKQYQFILGYSDLTNILYANDSLDITKAVLDGLNKEYKAEKGSK